MPAPIPAQVTFGADVDNFISSMKLMEGSYFRLSTATSSAILRIRAFGGAAQNVIFLLNALPAITAGIGRAGDRMAQKVFGAADAFGTLEQSLLELEFQGGLSEKQMASMREEILRLNLMSKFSSPAITDLARMLTSAGISAETAQTQLEQVVRFGEAFSNRIDLRESADIFTLSFLKWGDEVERTTVLLDRLAKMTQISRFEPQNLRPFLQTLGSVQEILPNQMSEILALAATLRRAGDTSAQAADHVRGFVEGLIGVERMMKRMEFGSFRAETRMKAWAKQLLNVSAFTKEGGLENLVTILDNMIAGLEKLPTAQEREIALLTLLRTDAAKTVRQVAGATDEAAKFGKRTKDGLLRGIEVFKAYTEVIDQADGLIMGHAEKMTKSTLHIKDVWQTSVQAMSEAVGEFTKDPLNAYRDMITKITNETVKWIKANEFVSAGLLNTAGVMGKMLSWGNSLIQTFSNITFSILSSLFFLQQMNKMALVTSMVTKYTGMGFMGGMALPFKGIGALFGKGAALRGVLGALGPILGLGTGVAGIAALAAFGIPAIIRAFKPSAVESSPAKSPAEGAMAAGPMPGAAGGGGGDVAQALQNLATGVTAMNARDTTIPITLSADGKALEEVLLHHREGNDARQIGRRTA